jgi:DNA-binding transcriptional LysR family regulator
MNLDRLRTFSVLAGSLHFRRTAAILHLSQSAVSQQISTLEEEVGVPLFERIGRRVFLTPAGTILAEEAIRVLAAVERAGEAVRTFATGEAGRLRLGASTTPGVYLLPDVLGEFRRSLPGVELSFRIANSAAIEEALVRNELDLGVVGEDIRQEELFQVPIAEDAIIGVVAPSLVGRSRQQRRLRVADLGRFPLLARESGSATRRYVDGGLARLGVTAPPAFELPSPEAQVRAAAAGLGLAFVSRHVAAADLAAGKVVEITVERLRLVRPLTAAYHRDKRVTTAMKEIIELARRRARRAPS